MLTHLERLLRDVSVGFMLGPALLLAVASCGGEGGGGGPVAVSIAISAPSDTIELHQPLQLSVTVRDEDEEVIHGVQAAWSSLDPAIATVSSAGVLASLSLGTARIVAVARELADTILITSGPKVTITMAGGATGEMVGDTVPLLVTLADHFNVPVVSAAPVTWEVSDPSHAAVLVGGGLVGLAPGPVTIHASVAGGTNQLSMTIFGIAGMDRELGVEIVRHRPADGADVPGVYMFSEPAGLPVLISDSNDMVGLFHWSPDGNAIVYTSSNLNGIGRSGAWTRVLGLNTFSQVSASGNRPRWMPDGQRIVFAEHDLLSSNVDIWTATASGGARQQLTSVAGVEHFPMPSPDGEWIAYRLGADLHPQLWLVRPNGSSNHRLILPFDVSEFDWSPDGRFIALNGMNGIDAHGAWLVRPDGTGLTSLTPDCTNDGSCGAATYHGTPSWNPNGREIMYWRTPPGGWELRVVHRDGSLVRSIPNSCGLGRFSPTGQRLAVADTAADGYCYPFVMNPDGGGRTQLTSDSLFGPNRVGSFQWRP